MKTANSTAERRRIQLGGTARAPQDVPLLQKLGLDFAEISVRDPSRFPDLIPGYREQRAGLEFYYLCHGPREGDPNDLQQLENVYLPKLQSLLPLMGELEMDLLTVHLWLDSRFVSRPALECKVELLREVVSKAAEKGITVCLENLSESPEQMALALEALPALHLTLDVGHAELLSRGNLAAGFLDRWPHRIGHIHLHDNRGGGSPADDLHLPVGEGIIDFERFFGLVRQVGYRGTMTLELRPEEIGRCLPYVRRLLESA